MKKRSESTPIFLPYIKVLLFAREMSKKEDCWDNIGMDTTKTLIYNKRQKMAKLDAIIDEPPDNGRFSDNCRKE